MATSRAAHLQWCKDRALAYVDRGDCKNAIASMASDLTKHPETNIEGLGFLVMVALLEANNPAAVRRWINGFN